MVTPTQIQTSINNLTTSCDAVTWTVLAAQAANADTGISFTVNTPGDLPDLSLCNIGPGQIVFVCSLGVPLISTENEWKGIDGRLYRTDCAVKDLWSWGLNSCGILGDLSTVSRSAPVREITYSNWLTVSVANDVQSGIKTNGTLWSMGDNVSGRLGNNSTTPASSTVQEFTGSTNWCSVAAGYRSTSALKTTGEIWSWGSNQLGLLGINRLTATNVSSPVQEVTSSTDWCSVSTSYSSVIAIKTSGQLWAWGNSACGNLGNNNIICRSSPVQEITNSTDWCLARSSFTSSMAIKTTGQLWTWGQNTYGRLGDNTTISRSSPVREITLSTNWCIGSINQSTLGVKTSGQLWAWGRGACGALGNNATVTTSSPIREITSSTTWCVTTVGCRLGGGIKTDGTLWMWGSNYCGALGDNSVTNRLSPVREILSINDWCTLSGSFRSLSGIRNR